MKIVKTGYIVYNPLTDEVIQKPHHQIVKLSDVKRLNFAKTEKGAKTQLIKLKEDLEEIIKDSTRYANEIGRTAENRNFFAECARTSKLILATIDNFEIREVSITTEIK